MYRYELFDAAMFALMIALILAFAVSLTHSLGKVKLEAVTNNLIHENTKLREEYATLLDDWSDASTYRYAMHDACVVYFCYHPSKLAHEQLTILMDMERNYALDPSVSKDAAALINKAKREHGKKIRKAADRKLERTEREYEARINSLQLTITSMQQSNTTLRGNMGAIRAELTAFQSIAIRVLEARVKLPSVRNAIIKDINQAHKAYQEL